MLLQLFPNLRSFRPVTLLRGFFRSALYLGLIVFLMVISELFALELAVFYIYLILGVLSLLVADDALAVVPIASCGYMTIARQNSTVHYLGQTIFDSATFPIHLAAILSVAVVVLTAHLVFTLVKRPARRQKPCLLVGFLALGFAYMLGGAFSSHYSARSALFGFVQLVSLALFYLYFSFTVDWENVPKWYAPALFTLIGCGVIVQIVGIYTIPSIWVNGLIDRRELYTGWGTYNNIACIIAMCIPGPCYFAATRRHGWAYAALSCLFTLALFFTQSRGGIIFGALTFFICNFYVIGASKGREKTYNLAIYLAFLAGLALCLYLMQAQIEKMFASMIEAGFDSSGRSTIFKNCWKAFKQFPVFGVGFYDTPGFAFDSVGSFLPPRAHNTYLQLFSTGGIVLVAAYLFHRAQTLLLLFKRRSPQKAFVALVVCGLLLTSILDCHFFNIGPGILYGIVLGFAEGDDRTFFLRKKLER